MTYKLFSYCPSVPWKIKDGIINDQLDLTRWNLIFDKRESCTILAYGGLLESYLSLFSIELYNKILPKLKISWAGNSRYKQLIEYAGLSKFIEKDLSLLKNEYPIPLFIKNNELYLNSLINVYNYIDTSGYLKKENTTPVFKQIYKNTQLQTQLIIPKLRSFEPSDYVQIWMQAVKFNPREPFYLIVPGRIFSNHKINLINKWDRFNYRQLCSLLRLKNKQVVVLSDNFNDYNDCGVKLGPVQLDLLIYLIITKPQGVITESIDIGFISGILSDAKLISNKIPFNLKLKENLKLINKKNSILNTRRYINPIRAANFLME